MLATEIKALARPRRAGPGARTVRRPGGAAASGGPSGSRFSTSRNPADADEAVQDAFIKVFLHIDRYREDLPFDAWFTRILVNASLDRLKARPRPAAVHRPAGRRRRRADRSSSCRRTTPSTRAPDAGPRSGGSRSRRRWPPCPTVSGWCSRSARWTSRRPAEIAAATGMSPRHGAGALVPGPAQTARHAGGARYDRHARDTDAETGRRARRLSCRRHTPKPTRTSTSARSRPSGSGSCARSSRPASVRASCHFPDRRPRRRAPRSPAVSRRWISAAAAAGLIIGLGTGQLLHVIPGDNWVNRDTATRPTAAPRPAAWPSCPRWRMTSPTRTTRCSMPSKRPSTSRGALGTARPRRPDVVYRAAR